MYGNRRKAREVKCVQFSSGVRERGCPGRERLREERERGGTQFVSEVR